MLLAMDNDTLEQDILVEVLKGTWTPIKKYVIQKRKNGQPRMCRGEVVTRCVMVDKLTAAEYKVYLQICLDNIAIRMERKALSPAYYEAMIAYNTAFVNWYDECLRANIGGIQIHYLQTQEQRNKAVLAITAMEDAPTMDQFANPLPALKRYIVSE
jgi:hypothetical protein